MKPKITIIIPCYNAEKWIEQCVMSCLNQTYESVEVIAVDNESSDGTVAILNDIKNNNPELIISSAKNIYPNCWDEAREEGFRLMTGDYVITIGSDDYIDLEYVDKCMSVILSSPKNIKAMQTPIQGIRQQGEEFVSTGIIQHSYKSKEQFKKLCLTKCPVNTPSVIYSSELYHRGLLETKPKEYGGAADYDLYCNLIDNDVFIYPFPQWLGFYYRWHPEQATWNVHKESRNYDVEIQKYWRDKWKM